MTEEKFHYAYIIFKENILEENTKGKLSSLIKSLNGIISYAQTSCESYGFLFFQNPILKSYISPHLSSFQIDESQLFSIICPVSDLDTPPPLFITNLPNGYKNSDLNALLNTFDKNASIEELIPDILTYLIPTKRNLLLPFLPYIKFKNEVKIDVTTDSFKVPVILVSNLPKNFRKKEFSLFKCPFNLIHREFKREEQQEHFSKSAYLSFLTNEEANKAIEYFNFAQIDQNEISAIHFTYKGVKDLKEWEISVKHISPESKGFDLWHRFKIYGPLLSAEIKKNYDSNSIYGIVQFYNKENAEAAIEDIKQQNTSIIVDFSVNFVVTIYNIDPSLSPQDIAQCFKQVSMVEIMQPQRGMMTSAVVSFFSTQAANNCLNSQQVFNGVRWIFTKEYQNKHRKAKIKELLNSYQKTNTIKINNLPKGAQLQTIISNCAQFGIIRYVSINSDTATVSFEDEKSAKEASAYFSNQ